MDIAKKLKLYGNSGDWGHSLSVYGDVLVDGFPRVDGHQGRVNIFNRVGGEWAQGQTIKLKDSVRGFGYSVAVYGQHMAVSTKVGIVFTYMLDQHTNTWVSNGKLSVTSGKTSVAIQNDILVAALESPSHPVTEPVCGVVTR